VPNDFFCCICKKEASSFIPANEHGGLTMPFNWMVLSDDTFMCAQCVKDAVTFFAAYKKYVGTLPEVPTGE
jgi:hypothetical protein